MSCNKFSIISSYTMPVLTRSQCKSMNNVSSSQKISSNKEKISSSKEKISSNKVNIVSNISNQKVNSGLSLERWFISIVQKYLTEIERLRLKKNETFKCYKYYKYYIDIEKYSQSYYEQMRNLSELFYVIQEYFPTLYSENPGPFKKFAIVMYNKIQELYIIIHNNRLVAKNKDESTGILVVLRELQATEKMLIPYLDDKPTRQKRCPRVDYTGMDMFEEDDEKEDDEKEDDEKEDDEKEDDDEDYVDDEQDEDDEQEEDEDDEQEEDEDDEQEEEDEQEEDEKEEDEQEEDEQEDDDDDEDYVEEEEDEEELLEDEKAEDEIFEIMMQQRIIKNQSNHIRFIYEDE